MPSFDRGAAWAVLFAACAIGACTRTSSCEGCDDESEEREERDRALDHYWRAQIEIVGNGRVHSFIDAFNCAATAGRVTGRCGPTLVRFKELDPATLEAVAAPGWGFVRWESSIREPDGGILPRAGPMPDGRLYLNGFGYSDTGELETVRAIFAPTSSDE